VVNHSIQERPMLRLTLLAVSATLLHTITPTPQRAGADSTVAFVDVSVRPMDRERVLEHFTVIVVGSRIERMGPASSVSIPSGALRIDGRGKYLMPGLVDMHAHFMAGTGDSTDGAARQFALFLANGVTAARGLGAPPGYVATRTRANAGGVLAPTLYVASRSINSNSVKSPAEAARAVRDARAAGYDLIKTHGGFDRLTYDSMIAAARETGMPVSGHVTSGYGLYHALESSQQVEHLDGYLAALAGDTGTAGAWGDQQIVTDSTLLNRIQEDRLAAVVEATRRSRTCSGPTLALFRLVVSGATAEEMTRWPEMKFVSPQMLTAFGNQLQQNGGPPAGDPGARRFIAIRDHLVMALYRAGVPLLAGGDSPQFFLVPGFSLHRELEAFREAGLSSYAVLETATVNAARCLGKSEEFGTVETGKRADLLLYDADPRISLASREHLAGVMTRGRWLPADSLGVLLNRFRSN
jgi:hypothetical protein